jgi:acyl-CoA thioester hydrolase
MFDEELAVECSIGEVRRSAFQIRFVMRVGERVAAEGHGWLVGFDYAAQKASPLGEDLRAVLVDAAG